MVKDKAMDSDTEGQHVECKYYLTAGGCKYGSFCRYSHSRAVSDVAGPLLNFIGLPIRLGEKECPYFMRNGSCGYGARCVFHHPEPSSIEKPYDKSLRSRDCESVPQQLAEDSKPHQELGSFRPLSDRTISHPNDDLYRSIPNSFQQHSGLNQYQAPEYLHQRSTHAHLTLGADKADMLQPLSHGDVEDYPERPGQLECAFFMKTGFCKFKSACRFHHPKNQSKPLLSEKGLPLRPGRSICRYYERFGVCKFGVACLFDHPENLNSLKSQDWSSSKPASDHYGGS
ncbi:OLC1v1011337C2 [Oldenlandia corymbosa var. corymbosa]|nr:OLC1v1011337C2 [Oldenlandia corymbosa var. corymbosa]